MTTDNKTMADVQPGGMVRLGDQLVLAKLVGAAGLMLAEIDTCGHEVDPAYRHTLYEAWKEGKAALSAQPSPAAAVPAGWKLVPIEPTWSMRNDGREFLIDGIEKEPERLAYFLWKTMINAAPEVP
ncbi:MAG: hypothetical protein PBU97_07945 [Stenotrophomonas maltophilia]